MLNLYIKKESKYSKYSIYTLKKKERNVKHLKRKRSKYLGGTVEWVGLGCMLGVSVLKEEGVSVFNNAMSDFHTISPGRDYDQRQQQRWKWPQFVWTIKNHPHSRWDKYE